MPIENRISVEIPPDVLAKVLENIEEIRKMLETYLIALSPEERHSIPKMSDRTLPFVEKTIYYVGTDPQFAPAYMQTAELFKDIKAVEDLNKIFRPLEQIVSNLDDSKMLAGSEAYITALSYYNGVKQAAKMDVPDAKVIYEDLNKRFPGRKGNPSPGK